MQGHTAVQFLANVNSCSRSLYVVVRFFVSILYNATLLLHNYSLTACPFLKTFYLFNWYVNTEKWKWRSVLIVVLYVKRGFMHGFWRVMALSTQESDEDRQYALVAKMDVARNMTTILKAIHFKDVRLMRGSVARCGMRNTDVEWG